MNIEKVNSRKHHPICHCIKVIPRQQIKHTISSIDSTKKDIKKRQMKASDTIIKLTIRERTKEHSKLDTNTQSNRNNLNEQFPNHHYLENWFSFVSSICRLLGSCCHLSTRSSSRSRLFKLFLSAKMVIILQIIK